MLKLTLEDVIPPIFPFKTIISNLILPFVISSKFLILLANVEQQTRW